MFLVIGAGIAVMVAVSDRSGGDPTPPLREALATMSAEGSSTSSMPAQSTPPPPGSVDCQSRVSPELVIGNGAGDRLSAPGVILAFEYAYYRLRDAKEMVALTSKDSEIREVEGLQKGIDSTPRGLGYCVKISATNSSSTWFVEITQGTTRGEPEVITQRLTTVKERGQWAIESFEEVSK